MGMSTWSHVHQRIVEHEQSRVHTNSTEAYFLNHKEKSIDYLLFKNQKQARYEMVKKKRQVLERVIDIVKLIGKRGLSYRGSIHEAAYTLDDPSLDHGNFLEILLLIKKIDVVLSDHLDNCIIKSKISHQSGNKNRGGLLTLISKSTVNLVIDSISNLIKMCISQEVQDAEMFAIELDTTQDISVKDQCAIVLRYVNSNGVQEKLIAMVNCFDSSGKGIFELLKNVLLENDLKIENCIANATDGAASMQGQYNGFTAWLSNASPGQIHVWCYSHILNLVLSDVTKTPINAATLYSLLNTLAVFFRESYQRMAVWDKNLTSDIKHRRLKLIGETRWWAKEEAIRKIFGTLDNDNNGLYIEVLVSLHDIEISTKYSPDIRTKAKHLKESFLKYTTILTAFLYLRIFKITTPLSKYLQTTGMDIHKSQQMVNAAIQDLKLISRNDEGLKYIVNKFIKDANKKLENLEEIEKKDYDILIETSLPQLRIRKRKKHFDELCDEDTLIDEPYSKYKIEVYNVVMDGVINSMEKRFMSNSQIYIDLSCCYHHKILNKFNLDYQMKLSLILL